MKSSLPQILTLVPIAAQHEASHELMEATCALYGLIHARYVLTTSGLEAMYAKYTLQVMNSMFPALHCTRYLHALLVYKPLDTRIYCRFIEHSGYGIACTVLQ